MVDESIDAERLGSGEVTERLLEIVARDYRTVAASSDRFQFSRSHRPLWALIIGILLIPAIIGIFILFVRTTESWSATIESDHRSVRLRVRGRVLPRTLVELRNAMATPSGRLLRPLDHGLVADPIQTPSSGGLPTMPNSPIDGSYEQPAPPVWAPPPVIEDWSPPVFPESPPSGIDVRDGSDNEVKVEAHVESVGQVSSPDQGDEGRTVLAPERRLDDVEPIARADVASPVGSTSDDPSDSEQHTILHADLTRLRQAEFGASDPPLMNRESETVYVIRFDTGNVEPIEDLVLVGRDPKPRRSDQRTKLIAIPDPSMSISKTHLTLEIVDGSPVIVDRGSKNGVVIDGPQGTSKLEPETRVPVPLGSIVRFGERTLTIGIDQTDRAVGT